MLRVRTSLLPRVASLARAQRGLAFLAVRGHAPGRLIDLPAPPAGCLVQSRFKSKSSKGHHADVNPILFHHCKSGNLEALQAAFAAPGPKVNVNAADYDDRSLLHVAASEGQLAIVQMLVDHGADLSARDRFGGTPLSDAIKGMQKDVIKYLKEHGAVLDNNDHAASFLHAVASGNTDLVELYLLAGMSPDQTDYDQRSALHIATSVGNHDMVQLLLRTGAAVNPRDRFRNTPLDDAYRDAHFDIAETLKAAGAVMGTPPQKMHQDLVSSTLKALPLLCERGGYAYAETWMPLSASRPELSCSDVWYAATAEVKKYTKFRMTAERVGPHMDKGFIEEVAITKEKRLFTMDQLIYDFRIEEAQRIGLTSGLAIPIIYEGKAVAVMVFYSKEPMPPQGEDTSKSIAVFTEFATRLVTAGLSSDLGSQSTVQELMNKVFTIILSEGVFSRQLIYQEVDWWFTGLGLQQFYFERFTAPVIARHIHTFMASKKLAQATGDMENIKYILEAENEAFYLGPDIFESVMEVQSRVESYVMNNLIDQAEKGSTTQSSQSSEEDSLKRTHFSIVAFRSSGPAVSNGTTRLSIHILESHEYVDPDAPESETDIWKISTGPFLRDKSALVRDRYQEIISQAVGRLSPVVHQYPPWRDNTIPIMFAFRRTGVQYMRRISELCSKNDIDMERLFVETFSNGIVVYTLYIQPHGGPKLQNLIDQINLLFILPETKLQNLLLDGRLTATHFAYATAVAYYTYYFLGGNSEEFEGLKRALQAAGDSSNLERLMALQRQLRRDAVSLDRIFSCMDRHSVLIKSFYDDFSTKFDPQSPVDVAEIIKMRTEPGFNDALHALVRNAATNDLDNQILSAFITFNSMILKTNFYKHRKSGLAFRLDPSFLRSSEYSDSIPYGVNFLLGSNYVGFHVRFSDIARGGIRLVISRSETEYAVNSMTLFNENYNLAWTQNKKNKDIPEFGSKGIILVPPKSKVKNADMAFKKYISGLCDIMMPVPSQVRDFYGKQELLFLGPDENTAGLMEWACLYAKQRGYPFWQAFTTGKPPSLGGIPHDTYAMTTRSVHRYVLGSLAKKGWREEDITKFQTGGPDGDLGSNEILISKDKTIGIVDGSGVIYDPDGLNRAELEELAHKRQMVKHYNPKALGPAGYKVLIGDRNIELPGTKQTVTSGLLFRNEFHLQPWLKADLFVPCGGRPESINSKNVKRMFDPNDASVPRFKIIVEGANLFLTQDARMVLERAGVVLYKDASANKGGVTSSSMEVLAALAMDDAEFAKHMQVLDPENVPPFYQAYVKEVQRRLEENADLEFECIWNLHQRTGKPRCMLTDIISDKVVTFQEFIQNSHLYNNIAIRETVLSHAIPKLLLDLLGLKTILSRVPENYIVSIFGAYLASRYVYKFGLDANELSFFQFMESLNKEQPK